MAEALLAEELEEQSNTPPVTDAVTPEVEQVEVSQPAKEAGMFLPSQQEAVTKDIEQRGKPAPVVDLSELLNSSQPLASFENASPNLLKVLDDKTLGQARLFQALKANKEEVPKDIEQTLVNSYMAVNAALQAENITAEASVPTFPIFGVLPSGEIDPKYLEKTLGFASTSEKRLALNRKSARQFFENIRLTQTNPEAASLLLEDFATGKLLNSIANRTKDLTGGGFNLYYLTKQAVSDYISAGGDLQKFREGKGNREQERMVWRNNWKDNEFLTGHTERMNNFIEEKYIKKYGQEKFDSLNDKEKTALFISPDHARAILDFSFTELGPLETLVAFGAENIGFNVGLKAVGAGIKSVLNFIPGVNFKSPQEYVMQMDKNRRLFKNADGINPYEFTPTTDFIRYQADAVKHQGWLKSLPSRMMWKTTRLTSKGESGFHLITAAEKKSPALQKFRISLDKAFKNFEDALKTGDKSAIESAEKVLTKTETAYMNQMYSRNPFNPGNSLAIPAPHLKALAWDEMPTTIAQGVAYELSTNPASENAMLNPNQLANAELYSALAYLGSAFNAHKLFTVPVGSVITSVVPVAADVSFQVKSFLSGSDLMTRVGIGGFRNLLDTDITELKIKDVDSNGNQTFRKLTADEYRGLKHMKDKYKRLDPETQLKIQNQKKIVDGHIERMTSVITDPALKEETANILRMSFSQVSGLTYFQALARKTAGHLSLRDVVKVSSRFKQASNFLEQAKKMEAGQAQILGQLDQLFIKLKDNNALSTGGEAAFRGVMDMNANLLAKMREMNLHQTRIHETTYEGILNVLKDKNNLIGKTPEELDQILDDLVSANMLIKPVMLDKTSGLITIDRSPLLAEGDRVKTVSFFKNNEEKMTRIQEIHTAAMEGVTGVHTSFLARTVAGTSLEDTVKKQYKIVGNKYSEISNEIYLPLKQFKQVNAMDMFTKVIDLNKVSNLADGGGGDNVLRSFIPEGQFARSSQGKDVSRIMDRAAEQSLMNAFLKGQPVDFSDGERLASARDEMADIMDTYSSLVRKEYNIPPYQSISNVHYYDFFQNNPKHAINIHGKPIEDVKVSFDDLENMRREMYARYNSFKNSTSANAASKAIDYKNIADDIDNLIMFEGAKIKFNKKTASGEIYETDVSKEMLLMRLQYGVEVGQRKEPDTLYGSFLKIRDAASPQAKESLIKTAAGMNWLTGIHAKTTAVRQENLLKFKNAIQKEFGVAVYPDQYIDKTTGLLRRDLDLRQVMSDGRYLSEHIKDGVVYRLDSNSEEGKAGIAMAQAAIKQMFTELNFYETIIEGASDKIALKDKRFAIGAGTTDPKVANSFFTRVDGTGIDQFKKYQESLMFETTNGPKLILDLDAIVDTETDIVNMLRNNKKAVEEINKEIDSMNQSAKSMKNEEIERINVKEVAQNEGLKYIGKDDSKQLVEGYLGSKGQLLDRLGVDETAVVKFKHDKGMMADANPQMSSEEVDKVYAGMLLDGIMENGNYVNISVTDMNGKQVSTRTLENPQDALAMLELETTRQMFKEVGVDDDHYEALLATLGHMTIMKEYKANAGLGNVSLPPTGYSDTGIMARAFNYARGMVSSEYLIVEAGFRIMRDNDMQLMDFLLNDKDAAEYLMKMVSGEDQRGGLKTADFHASTFYDQMKAYIIRQLAGREEGRGELELVNQFENMIDEEMKELKQEETNLLNQVPKFEMNTQYPLG